MAGYSSGSGVSRRRVYTKGDMPEYIGCGKSKPDSAIRLKEWRYRFSGWSDRRVSAMGMRGSSAPRVLIT